MSGGNLWGSSESPFKYRLTGRSLRPPTVSVRPGLGTGAGRVPAARAASPRPPGATVSEPTREPGRQRAPRERRQRPEVSRAQSVVSKDTFKDQRSTGQGKRNGRLSSLRSLLTAGKDENPSFNQNADTIPLRAGVKRRQVQGTHAARRGEKRPQRRKAEVRRERGRGEESVQTSLAQLSDASSHVKVLLSFLNEPLLRPSLVALTLRLAGALGLCSP